MTNLKNTALIYANTDRLRELIENETDEERLRLFIRRNIKAGKMNPLEKQKYYLHICKENDRMNKESK